MNKYENAIDIVARYCSDVRSGATPRMTLTNELDILMELVERAKPKKPVKDEPSRIRLVQTYACPNCGKFFSGRLSKYCYHCGQALDWSDEE